ncbi:LysM peptidoglycan-binding domain-containing protein [Shimia thalassica]|uniref:LysM peptidoglycan-binding domain-containing protein n=1 Tax=Shimia thalassica TaxID=1715693 RepID=UPI002090D3D5|nr:LysM peptidoglycan-binding domain-containing protein [Shimia thalassica]MDO6503778.1 LysM peptidoglycan-binding domain-containing protein [Shimia thalassica]
MSAKASLFAGNGALIGGGVVVVAAVTVAAVSGVFSPSEPVLPVVETAQPVVATPPQPLQPEPKPEPVPEKEVAEVIRPSFDVVRVETDGNTLIAGQGAQSLPVKILMDGAELIATETDASGKFVSFVELAPSDNPRVLSLVQKGADGDVTSEETIIIAPTPKAIVPEPTVETVATETETQVAEAPAAAKEAVEDEVAEATTTVEEGVSQQEVAYTTSSDVDVAEQVAEQVETAQEAVQQQVQSLAEVAEAETGVTEENPATKTAGQMETEPAEVALAEPEAAPTQDVPQAAAEVVVSPTVLKADADGITVLQAPVAENAAPEIMSTVALDAITYSDKGEVELSGRANNSGFVRVYLDNKPITSSKVAADGNWRTELPDVDTGIYTLRVDQVDEAGAVTSRIETPFKREDDATVEANQQQSATQATSVRVVTVQPGSTLWAIASERYGEGLMYVRVFEANRDRIRDPDLIYPGQIFEIPE